MVNDTLLNYHAKDNLVHNLHPLSNLSYILAISILALIFHHPLYLASLLLAAGLVVVSSGHGREWSVYLKFAVSLTIIILLLNMIFSREGETILFSLKLLPNAAPLDLSLESLAFAGGMGLRLLVIITAFCLYAQALDPDRILRLFSGVGKGKTILAITLSARLFPQFVSDYRRIMEISRCRGIDPYQGKLGQRIRRFRLVVAVLFSSALEEALGLAESMYARGYGSGQRSQRKFTLWRPRDFLVIAGVISAFSCGILAYGQGWTSFIYYPRLAWEFSGPGVLLLMTISLVIPSILNWGCKLSPHFLSKI